MLTKNGRKQILGLLRQNISQETYRIGLDTQYQAMNEEDVEWEDIVEATFDGYTRKNFSFTEELTLNGSDVGVMETGVLTWEHGAMFTGTVEIHGIFVLCPGPLEDKTFFYKKVTPAVELDGMGAKYETRLRFLATNYAP